MKSPAEIRREFFESAGSILPVDRLFDGVPDIVFFIKDALGRYVAVNDTLVARCGRNGRDELIGRTVEQVFPPPLSGEFARQDVEILKTGTAIRDRLELHLYPGGASGWCLTYKEPIAGKNGGVAGICGISRDLHAPGEQRAEFSALSSAVEHIHRHYDEPLRLPQLAEMAGLSVYQFDQRIRSLFHLTAGQYLVKVRIDAACKQLAKSKEAIAQIALGCGYSDQSAFSRQFKQAVGISPLEYRKRFGAGS
ncbi:MAG: AraC family transcriptional regulator [Akkermansiaceae bacterium]|nr:AraC family transcriptional regulator [Akkermansiaceae bacterium]MCP5548694.1 AraC family transcriptional regulator [Akkermansiaceae bacterium]